MLTVTTMFSRSLIMWLQDAETVATGIMETSEGKIRTGVYHSEVGDKEKEGLHKRWRRGDVKVVCATIGKLLSLIIPWRLILKCMLISSVWSRDRQRRRTFRLASFRMLFPISQIVIVLNTTYRNIL